MATESSAAKTAWDGGDNSSPGSPAQIETLKRIPQGGTRVLVIGSPDLVRAHAALSPSSRHTRLDDLDEAGLNTAFETGPFDAIVVAFGAGDISDRALAALRQRSLDGTVLVWLRVQPPAGPDDKDAAALAALAAAGWKLIDATPVIPQDATSGPAQAAGNGRSASVIRAIIGAHPAPVTVAALGMRKFAGVTDARIDHPMSALASRPLVRATWGAGGVQVPGGWPPGVLILHRQFMDGAGFVEAIEKRIAAGWVVVSEIDDDPRHWPEFGRAGYRAFRGVHAVSVSTEPLARMIRRLNPHVTIFPNAVPYLPVVEPGTPKDGRRVRVFFGAINREKDWAGIVRGLEKVALDLADVIEFVVVHDRAFFEALPDVPKSFHETLPYDDYLALLATCDIALLPLNDTPFNRLKSDIKFIECCAAGVVPVCSGPLYAENPRHREIGVFAESAKDWVRALRTLARDPEEVMRRRKLGLDYVRAERMHADQTAFREETYRALIADRERLETERKARLAG